MLVVVYESDDELVPVELDQSDVLLDVVDPSYDELVELDQSDIVPLDDVPLDAANAAPEASAFAWKPANVSLTVGFIANSMPLTQWLAAVFAPCSQWNQAGLVYWEKERKRQLVPLYGGIFVFEGNTYVSNSECHDREFSVGSARCNRMAMWYVRRHAV